jgi:hypothetical protein
MRGHISLGWVAGLSVAAALGTALGEATFFHLAYHAPLLLVLQTNLTLATGLGPAPTVLAVGLGVTPRRRRAHHAAERAALLAPSLSLDGYGALPSPMGTSQFEESCRPVGQPLNLLSRRGYLLRDNPVYHTLIRLHRLRDAGHARVARGHQGCRVRGGADGDR